MLSMDLQDIFVNVYLDIRALAVKVRYTLNLSQASKNIKSFIKYKKSRFRGLHFLAMIHQHREFHYTQWRSAVLTDRMSTTNINGFEFHNNFRKCTSSSSTAAHVAKPCINALKRDVLIFTLPRETSIEVLGGWVRTVILWRFCRGKMNIFVVMKEFYYYAWRFQGWMGGFGRKHQFDVLRGNLHMDVALTEKFASGKPA